MPRGMRAIGYVDDTLVVAEGDTVDAVQERGNVALEIVLDHICGLGFHLSAKKTQAMVFTRRYGAAKLFIVLEG